jgi:MFS family permease
VAVLGLSTLAFGFLHTAPLLDAARFAEGIGGACSWAGGIAWIVAEAPVDRRGTMIGMALGAAIGGALFGPLIGTIATAIGRAAAFSGVVVVALGLVVVAQRITSPARGPQQGIRDLHAAARHRVVIAGMWLVALPAVASGILGVLGPLRLHRFGATAAGIGATFLIAAAIEAVISPTVGRLSDRRGRMLPLRAGLLVVAAVLLCFTLPTTAVVLAIVVIATASALGAFWAPAMALLSDAADERGLDQGLAAALMNLAWAGGQIVGSGAGGAVAKAVGDGLPIAITAGMCLATLVLLMRWRSLTVLVGAG